MKEQTLEEAANKANGYNIYAKETKAPIFNEGFIAGAKWQEEQAKEMEREQQGKFTIDFINWLHLNQYKYNSKAKLYQKHFINETLFFSIDELFITFKQQDNEELN
jgi:hypothetical protein